MQVTLQDPLWTAARLWCDKDLRKEGLLTKFEKEEVVVDGETTRVYGELNTGTWWEETEKDVAQRPGAIMCPILLYQDQTWLSLSGSHTSKPCSMGIGNYPIATQNVLGDA